MKSRRKRLFDIIEVGNDLDVPSRIYDFVNAFSIVLNIIVAIMYTFDDMRASYGSLLLFIENATVVFFAVDYCLRIYTAKYLYKNKTESQAMWSYIKSFTGVIDLLSFLPYYLPIFFPAGAAAFRMIRLARIFRLFKINAYYDSLHVITDVIKSKRQQLVSSVFIIVVLMIASSLCMYSLEHEAQPEQFKNALTTLYNAFEKGFFIMEFFNGWFESVKLDKEGSLYYQLIFNRRVKHLNTPYKIKQSEWDDKNGCIICSLAK